MKETEEIFENIIKEAASGYIDCDFFLPICFGTKEVISNEVVDVTKTKYFANAMIPTLVIKDRDKLIISIEKYLSLAEEFYKEDPRVLDVRDKKKYIIASLLANTLVDDFMDISNLYNRYSDFLTDHSLDMYLESQNIGFSSILGADVVVSLNKESICEETPYGINIHLEDADKNNIYQFPTIRFGISQNKAYIYAVQRKNIITNKVVDRKLRKVGYGFDEKNCEKDTINNPENLYSITPSTLIALSIAIPIINNCAEVKEFVVPYFLVNRWNAVEVSYEILKEKYQNKLHDDKIQKILSRKREDVIGHDDRQRNITDKFLRNFRRLDYHFSNINITSLELEIDSSLHFTVSDDYGCNNKLMDELYIMSHNFSRQNIDLKNRKV